MENASPARRRIARLITEAVAANPGRTQRQISESIKVGMFEVGVVLALDARSDAPAFVRRLEDPEVEVYYIAGKAPACPHNRTRRAIGSIDPTDVCGCCGATRKWSSAVWS